MVAKKPPVPQGRPGGFLPLCGLLIAGLFLASSAVAERWVFAGQTMYDYPPPTAAFQSRLIGHVVGVILPGQVLDHGFYLEFIRYFDGSGYQDFINPGINFQVTPRRGVFLGVGAGLVMHYVGPTLNPPFGAYDLYGKAVIVDVPGHGNIRGFVGYRWVYPTPFGIHRVLRFGFEVNGGM